MFVTYQNLYKMKVDDVVVVYKRDRLLQDEISSFVYPIPMRPFLSFQERINKGIILLPIKAGKR